MAKLKRNAFMNGLSGVMEDWTFLWTHGQQTVMKTQDMSKVKWSKARKATVAPKVRAHYEKVAKKAAR